jgi:hypothetical protein
VAAAVRKTILSKRSMEGHRHPDAALSVPGIVPGAGRRRLSLSSTWSSASASAEPAPPALASTLAAISDSLAVGLLSPSELALVAALCPPATEPATANTDADADTDADASRPASSSSSASASAADADAPRPAPRPLDAQIALLARRVAGLVPLPAHAAALRAWVDNDRPTHAPALLARRGSIATIAGIPDRPPSPPSPQQGSPAPQLDGDAATHPRSRTSLSSERVSAAADARLAHAASVSPGAFTRTLHPHSRSPAMPRSATVLAGLADDAPDAASRGDPFSAAPSPRHTPAPPSAVGSAAASPQMHRRSTTVDPRPRLGSAFKRASVFSQASSALLAPGSASGPRPPPRAGLSYGLMGLYADDGDGEDEAAARRPDLDDVLFSGVPKGKYDPGPPNKPSM